jgi:small-conductance mechanosensitive channel
MLNDISQWLSQPMVKEIIISIVGILLIAVIVRLLQKSTIRQIEDSGTRYRVRKLITSVGYLAAVLFISMVFRDQLGHVAVAFGVAGVGIAFALQQVILSIAGWLAISLGNFYQIGDRVQLGGIVGDVIDIGVLRTTLMECGDWVKSDLYNGRIVRVVNSFVFNEPVFNYSRDFPYLWDEITVPVKYGSDIKLAREVLERVVDEVAGGYVAQAADAWKGMVRRYRLEHEGVEPMVTLTANDNWIEFTVRYVVDYKRRRVTKDQLFTRMLEAFEKTNGSVSIASTTLQIVETPMFDVRLQSR